MEKVCHNPRRQTVLHPKHHCCGPILQKFSSTKSTGSGLSSQRTHRNSWSKRRSECPRFPCDPLATSTGFLLQLTSGSRAWCWPSRLSTDGTAPIYLQTLVRPHAPARALPSTTSAGLTGTTIAENKQSSLSEVTTLLCSGASVGGTNSEPMPE